MSTSACSFLFAFPAPWIHAARAAVFLLPVLLCLVAGVPAGAAMQGIGTPAQDFRLADVEGQPVQLLQRLSERAVLLLFSSIGCIPCDESAPAVRQLSERFGGQLEVLCVMLSEAVAVRRWLASGDGYPGARILVNPDGSAAYETAREYGVLGTPTSFLVGRDGAVLWRHVGRLTVGQVEGELSQLLAAHSAVAAPAQWVAARGAQ